MRIWLTADLHLGHTNVLEFEPGRRALGATIQEHDAALVARINSRVAPEDRLIILGDVCLGSAADTIDYLNALHGTKILVRGNHDKHSNGMYLRACAWVCTETHIKVGHSKLTLSHYPYHRPWWYELLHGRLRDAHKRPPDRGGWLVHGHVHGQQQVRGRMIHVGVDAWNYYPVPLDKVLTIMGGSK